MESSSILQNSLPPSVRLTHLWPVQDRLEQLRAEQLQRSLAIQEAPKAADPEWNKCAASAPYFIVTYVVIYDATLKGWIPFDLWPEQETSLETIHINQLVVILKARQLGLTWLVLAYFLWLMIFHPSAAVLVFSLRDTEAKFLLGDERWRGMFTRLPANIRTDAQGEPLVFVKDDEHVRTLSNGSTIKAFPTSAGDSYTATAALVDEADLVPDLNKLMGRVKPTIDGGGKMILLSRSDKKHPQSEFKRIYRAAKQKLTDWIAIFLSYSVRPGRTGEWYAKQRADILHRTGSLDDLHEQYPRTDTEALAPRSLDKRIAPDWIEKCYAEMVGLNLDEIGSAPSIPGLIIYRLPEPRKQYVQGVDTAEGNPTSDDSSIHVLERDSGEEVAKLSGKLQPAVTGAHADTIGCYFNNAPVLVERNNHGHAVLLWLESNSKLERLKGSDGKDGWLDNSRGKTLLYDAAADAFRTQDTILHSFSTHTQLSSIEGSSLRAPDGEPDDEADSYSLGLVARTLGTKQLETVKPIAIDQVSQWAIK
jgi:hypothetical protein